MDETGIVVVNSDTVQLPLKDFVIPLIQLTVSESV